jgi:hypothetical protein
MLKRAVILRRNFTDHIKLQQSAIEIYPYFKMGTLSFTTVTQIEECRLLGCYAVWLL